MQTAITLSAKKMVMLEWCSSSAESFCGRTGSAGGGGAADVVDDEPTSVVPLLVPSVALDVVCKIFFSDVGLEEEFGLTVLVAAGVELIEAWTLLLEGALFAESAIEIKAALNATRSMLAILEGR